MKVIYVGGEDYAALNFEQSEHFKNKLDTWKKIKKGEFEECEDYPEVLAFEFKGSVDPKFIEFLFSDIIDYDHAKSTSFYIVKEK